MNDFYVKMKLKKSERGNGSGLDYVILLSEEVSLDYG